MRAYVIAACVAAAVLSSGLVSALAARTAGGPEAEIGSAAGPGRSELAELATTVESLRERVATLERELAGTRATGVGETVTAPFTVVNGAGTPIFTVTDAAAGNAVKGRVHIGRGSSDNYGVWVIGSGGKVVTAMAESKLLGIGNIVAYKGGKDMAIISEEGFVFKDAADKMIGHLGPDPQVKSRARLAVRGVLQLYDESFNTTVDAGTLPDGRGAVRTWPNTNCKSFKGLISPQCIVGAAP